MAIAALPPPEHATPHGAAPTSGIAERWRQRWQRAWQAPLVRRFLHSAGWNLLAVVFSRGCLLVAMILAARTLGRELTGGLGVVQNTMGLFGVFAGCGLGVATTRFVAEYRRTDPARAGRVIAWTQLASFGLGVLFAGLCAALSGWLSSSVLASPGLVRPLLFGSALVLFHTIQGVQSAALAGFESFRAVAVVHVVHGTCLLGFVIPATQWGGLEGAVLGLAAASLVQAACGQVAVRMVARAESAAIRFADAWQETGSLLRFGVPAALSALIVFPTEWVATALLANQPEGYAQLGLYSAACQWFGALMLLPNILAPVALPMLSDRWSQRDGRGFVRVVLLAMACNLVVLLPVVALAWWHCEWLMTRSGPAFAEGASALCLLLLVALVLAIQTPIGNSLQASGHSRLGLAMNLAWSATYISLAVWRVADGAQGIAQARLAAYVAHTGWVAAAVFWLWSTRLRLPAANFHRHPEAVRPATP